MSAQNLPKLTLSLSSCKAWYKTKQGVDGFLGHKHMAYQYLLGRGDVGFLAYNFYNVVFHPIAVQLQFGIAKLMVPGQSGSQWGRLNVSIVPPPEISQATFYTCTCTNGGLSIFHPLALIECYSNTQVSCNVF